MSDDATEVVQGLAAKLDGLDLTDEEQQLLDGILDRAAQSDPEVEGYGVVFEVETTVVKSGQPMGARVADQSEWVTKLARASGADVSQLGVWTDMRP